MIYRNRELKVGDKVFSTVHGDVVVSDIQSGVITAGKYCYWDNGVYDLDGICCLFYPDEKPKYPPEPVKKYQWVMKNTMSQHPSFYWITTEKYSSNEDAQELVDTSIAIGHFIPPEDKT